MADSIILASTSAKRKELLKQIGLDVIAVPSSYEEDMALNLSPEELAMTLAMGKAKAVSDRLDSGIVIGIDTFITLDGKKIGKPKDADDAKKILRSTSGRMFEIYSGIAIIDAKTKKELRDYDMTRVYMHEMTDPEIDGYVKTGEPLGKAGAFAIQGKGAVFVKSIDGCYYNVVGAPLYRIARCLNKLGIRISDNWI